MRLNDLKKLIDQLNEQQLDTEVYVSFLTSNEQKPLDFLQIIENLKYAALLRTTSFGTEVCVTDPRQ